MDTLFSDITSRERALLARLRFCPGAFLGEASLRNFRHMCGGYRYAMQTAGLLEQHNLLPDGLDAFAAAYLNADPGTRNCFTMIAEAEPDDGKAMGLFFRILDAYLAENGMEPLPQIHNWEEFREI